MEKRPLYGREGNVMAKEQVTRRQKDVSRLLREKKNIRKDRVERRKKK
ncbi:MAG TPA: hypothetical protein PK425_04865 [Syntrophales bacterium]|nr:hypothetical protein [Syntrophales bacterium]HPX55854.1 hypothetical protein [Syntrophales bacterium]HQA82599.1 hypothetical protein [Syntrophales bacterium]